MKQMTDYEMYMKDIEYLDNLDYQDESECAIQDTTDLDFSIYYM